MKVNFNKDILGSAISTALSCVSTKSTIASAEGILLDCTGERAVIVGYDMEKGIRIEIDANIIEQGACVINAASLNSIIKLMPAAEVSIEVGPTWRAKISSGSSEFEINGMDPREYPTLPDISNRKGFNIKQKDLKNMITRTLFAVAQNDARATFNGALFRINGKKITTVGCDSFRLAVREKVCDLENTTDADGELDMSFIVPGRTLGEVVKLLNEPDETVSINVSRKQVIFRFENRDIVFFSRLIEGDYIDYERIIPKNSAIFVEIDTASFQGALERASVVTDEAAGKNQSSARCFFHDNKVEITSVSASGKVHDEIPTTQQGGEIEIGFNCRYLTDALRAAQCDTVRLSLSTPLISMIIEPSDADENDRFTFLVVPFRMLK